MLDLLSGLDKVLRPPLPGVEAQRLMSPRPRRGWRPEQLPADCRSAAALLLLYPRHDEIHTLLTLRQPDLNDHAGQVSLPGGAAEPGENPAETARREAHEEVGVAPDVVRIVGPLTPLHIPASGFHLHPVLGYSTEPFELVRSEREVARVLEVSLRDLAAPDTLKVETWERGGSPMIVPYFLVEDLKVWGATAMVLSELLALLGAPPDPWNGNSESPATG